MAAERKPVPQSQSEPASDQSATAPAAPSSLSMLAQEQFGADYHGEVETPKPLPPPDLPEIPDEDLDEGQENVQVEGDDVEPSTPDEAAAEKTEEPIGSVKELVDYLEADPDWFQGLKVDVTVNGNPSQVPLKDVIEAFRTNQAADERLELAKSKSAQAQQEFAERNAALDLQYQQAANLVMANEQQLLAEAAAVNWDKLKQEDPAMWSAERVRFGERQNQIQQMKQQTAWEYQQLVAQRQQEQSQNRSVVMQEQSQLLMQNMPKVSSEWADPQKVPEAKGRLSTYLIGAGFTPKEIEETTDHRNFLIAEKARLWDESQGKLQITKKRMRTVPKVMKPGAGREPSTVNLEKIRKAREQLSKSNHPEDALKVLRLLREKRS